jgi:ABC-2 type transport system ATP-binding protein
MSAIIETQGLVRRYGARVAVDHLDMTVRRGSITGFLGKNGAGKTTTLRMLLGLIRPRAGRAIVCGVDVTSAPPPLARIGAIIETPAAWPWLSARDVLRVCARVSGVRRGVAEVDALLGRVGLTGREGDLVRTYSLGMKQRLGLACALLTDPELLLLDEPMNGLDPVGVIEMRTLLAGLAREGRTLVVSSHQLGEIQQLCDDVVILHEGRARYAGPMQGLTGQGRVRLRARPRDVARATLVTAGHAVVDDTGSGDGLVVTAAADDVPGIVRALVAGGVDVLAVEAVTSSLEQAFLDVLGSHG